MCTLAFLDKVSEFQQCMHAESVCRWITLAFHCSARLTSLKTASSSARFMCLSLSICCNQLLFSAMDLPFSITLVARELASTNRVMSCPFTHQSLWDGFIWDALAIISACIQCKRVSCTSSSHPVVTAFLHFTDAIATQSQPHTGKCSVNFLKRKKMLRQVSTLGAVRNSPPCCYCSLLCSSQMCKPNTQVPFFSCSESLLVNPNCLKCSFTWAAGHILSLMNISLRYEEVVLLMTLFCLTTALTTDCIQPKYHHWSYILLPPFRWHQITAASWTSAISHPQPEPQHW